MASLATRLRISAGDYLKEPVIDNTGLDGIWDFTLRWTPRARALPDGAARITISDADARTTRTATPSRLEPSAGDDDLRAMTRALLIERFHIQWHSEDQPMDACSLGGKELEIQTQARRPLASRQLSGSAHHGERSSRY